VAEHQDELRLLRQGELDATEWQHQGHDLVYLWHPNRLDRLQGVIESLPQDRIDPTLRAFAWPQQTLIRRLDDSEFTHATRDNIGHYLSVLGDPRTGIGVREDGTPDIDWVLIPGGEIELEGGTGRFSVKPFHMARYLITNAQFQAFVDAEDGYKNPDWWKGMPANANDGPDKPRWAEPDHPRETVSWYEAVAFCRWLTQRLGFEVRLPTEAEWQQAATGGDPKNTYPWGPNWEDLHCNTVESGLNRTTAVGLYPAGANVQGVLDLSGNLEEWCLSKYQKPDYINIDESDESRVLRGGSWLYAQDYARAAYRDDYPPYYRYGYLGFRVLCASPIR
jgi:formylglycine-generating enzyme required for sulfatase activity